MENATANSIDLYAEYEAQGLRYYTPKEEFWNSITHGIGTPIALAFMIYFLVIADSLMEVLTALLLCLPAIQVYTTSGVYHALTNKKKKSLARRIDHANISFLVTACGVPSMLLVSNQIYNYIGLALCFAIAFTNACLCVVNLMKFKRLGVFFDITIGVILLVIFLLNASLVPMNIKYIYGVGLGLCVIGVILYGIKSIKYVHTIFHVATLIGPVLFFVGTIFLY